MKTIESVKDFKEFLKSNRDKILAKAVRIEDLPIDDEWILDEAIDDMEHGRVQTIEEAWKEIDAIS